MDTFAEDLALENCHTNSKNISIILVICSCVTYNLGKKVINMCLVFTHKRIYGHG